MNKSFVGLALCLLCSLSNAQQTSVRAATAMGVDIAVTPPSVCNVSGSVSEYNSPVLNKTTSGNSYMLYTRSRSSSLIVDTAGYAYTKVTITGRSNHTNHGDNSESEMLQDIWYRGGGDNSSLAWDKLDWSSVTNGTTPLTITNTEATMGIQTGDIAIKSPKGFKTVGRPTMTISITCAN